jgi:hypothetical protein
MRPKDMSQTLDRFLAMARANTITAKKSRQGKQHKQKKITPEEKVQKLCYQIAVLTRHHFGAHGYTHEARLRRFWSFRKAQ